jgi:hypothetical protein
MRVLLGYKRERRTDHEAEPIYGGTDYWGVERRGSRGSGKGDQPKARDL